MNRRQTKITKIIILIFVFVGAVSFVYAATDEFHTAIKNGDIFRIKRILDKKPGLVNDKDKEGGWPPLVMAAFYGRKDVIELLLEKGANVNSENIEGFSGTTPLIEAVDTSHFEIAELLLLKGANVNARTHRGVTPLLIVAQRNYVKSHTEPYKMAQLLIEKGAKVNEQNDDGETALNYASIAGNYELAQLLVSNRANVNLKNRRGDTPLHSASIQGLGGIGLHSMDTLQEKKKRYQKVVELLIAEGADVNARNDAQKTPVNYAVMYNNVNIIELLVQKGANINTKDCYGDTPLHFASENCSKKLAEFLVSNGANVNIKDKNGWTPLHFAIRYKNKDIINLLRKHGAKE